MKVSPYITPPSRLSAHTCRLPLNESRGYNFIESILEVHAPRSVTPNQSDRIRMSLIESLNSFRGVNIPCRDPFIVFMAIALPLHQKLELLPEEASVEDLLNLIFFLTIYHYWWGWGWLSAARERVFRCWSEFDNWEHGV